MSGANTVAPVIIKRKKKVVGGGHHGGAWKVAYADFVTAMMAFFLLMWLLSSTTEKQRSGLADYFSPTVAVARVSGGGDGVLSGDSVMSEQSQALVGRGASSDRPTESAQARGSMSRAEEAERAAEDAALRSVEERLTALGGESMVADALMDHIVTRVTDEGLVIELFETEDGRLFDRAGAPTPLLRVLVDEVRKAADFVTNPVAIEAHVAASPLVVAEDRSWDVSRDRAGMVKSLMLQDGFADARLSRVTAHADREPATENRMAVRNNRVEIILLRQ